MEKKDIYEAMYRILQERAREIEEAGSLEESLREPIRKAFVALGREILPDFDNSYLENAIIETYCLVKYPPQKEKKFFDAIFDSDAYDLSRTYIAIHGAVRNGAKSPDEVYNWLSKGIEIFNLFNKEAFLLITDSNKREKMFQEYKEEIEPMLVEFAEYCRQKMSTGSPR